jgi:DNA-binding CsgD family transcriptional regulator
MLLDSCDSASILLKYTTNSSIIYVTWTSSERMMVSQRTLGGNVADRIFGLPVMTATLPDDTPVPARQRPDLAPREKEVLLAWILNDNKDDVARQLQISSTTVRTHLQRIRDKYAAAGRPANTKATLLARAIQDGLIDVNDL